jgi:hypothetical protein
MRVSRFGRAAKAAWHAFLQEYDSRRFAHGEVGPSVPTHLTSKTSRGGCLPFIGKVLVVLIPIGLQVTVILLLAAWDAPDWTSGFADECDPCAALVAVPLLFGPWYAAWLLAKKLEVIPPEPTPLPPPEISGADDDSVSY